MPVPKKKARRIRRPGEFRVIWAQRDDGEPVTQEMLTGDWPELVRQDKAALKEHPWWDAFGGVIRVADRQYQIA